MTDYTFIVGSTINATEGIIDNDKRFRETLETLDSIRNKVDAKILFVDNSIQPLSSDQKEIIKSKTNMCEFIDPNLFTIFSNGVGSKGLGEAYMLFHALSILENQPKSKRIFKLSARYKLADSFDISIYDNPELNSKYCFRVNDWDVSLDGFNMHRETVTYYETRLFSFCSTLFYEYADVVKSCFDTMIREFGRPMCNWEKCHNLYIPKEKVIKMNPIHVEGINAENAIYRFE